jgi:hypothetical protein
LVNKRAIAGLAAMGAIAISPVAKASTPATQYFNHHPAFAKKMCGAYFTLVNQGWTDSAIFERMDNAGAFEGFDSYFSHMFFKAMVQWCFAHSR